MTWAEPLQNQNSLAGIELQLPKASQLPKPSLKPEASSAHNLQHLKILQRGYGILAASTAHRVKLHKLYKTWPQQTQVTDGQPSMFGDKSPA